MNSNKYTLDRYEENVGVLLLKGDESQELLVDRDKLAGAKEGDILLVETDGSNEVLKVTVLEEETKVTKEKIEGLLEMLKNKKL
ncbi:DUF3006 domain-containing protein [Bacillus thermotolerans]|uniref:DUF3006 domain-containing protein n=1 Tax=Bacillus thermotolerans TaxID=1221996 RepID=UPI00057D6CDA|nr:DUF3006 domain-containing protein [Bacillus thermotolerans]KKB34579.1 hypothetical protein QY97_02228 [Bacillus thermotolerans]